MIKFKRWLPIIAIAFGVLSIGATSFVPVFPVTPRFYVGRIANGDTTTAITIFTGSAQGTLVNGFFCTSDEATSAHSITIQRLRTNAYPIITIQVPALAGTGAGVPPVNVIAAVPGLPGGGEPYFYVESTDAIQMKSDGTVTNGKFVTCSVVAADFG